MKLWSNLRHTWRMLTSRAYWEAAVTDRLNASHWSKVADDQSINDRTASDLPTTRARCIAEAEQNPTVDGVIFTHQVDIVGTDGPELQVQSSSEAYNKWLEKHWRQWFRAPTPNPRRSGATLLRLWIRAIWEKGEFLAQKVNLPHLGTPVSLRLQPIDPKRLANPLGQINNKWLAEGVEIRPEGEPIRYYIQPSEGISGFASVEEPEPVPAADIVHMFLERQEDQLRGIPLLASSLPSIATLRDYDADVGESVRQAANTGVYWYTDSDDAKYLEVDDQLSLERGTQATGPPGWKPAMLTPQQPTHGHREIREERHADIGRPAAMPLMIVRLDAGRHNYSSARFDGMNYDRAAGVIQNTISGSERSAGPLYELVDDVAEQAALADKKRAYELDDATLLPPARPDDVVYEFTWPRPPKVDPQKEAEGIKAEMDMGTLPYSDAVARTGKTSDRVIEKRARDNKKLSDAELPPVPGVMSRGTAYAQHELATGATPKMDDADETDDADGDNTVAATDDSLVDQE